MSLYSDLNQFNPQKSALLTDIASVYQSIANILNTRVGERLFNPEFGSDLERLLFEPIDEETSLMLRHVLIQVIEKWDNRVDIDNARTVIEPLPDENMYRVQIVFVVKGVKGELFEYVGSLRR